MFPRPCRYAWLAPVLVIVLATGCAVFAQQNPPPGPTDKDVVYGVADGQNLLLDVYRCPTPGPHPAVVMIHGGGWRGGDKAGDRGTAVGLSTRAGITCFSINYRLAPQFTYPAQVLDCARAVRWVRAHAPEYDVDPDRIAAWGGSAGGHLSLMLGVINPTDFQSPDDPNKALSAKVKCVVDIFGPSDLTGNATWPANAVQIAEGFLGASREQAPDKYAQASPITHVTADDAPVMMLHGDKDSLVPLAQSEVMKAALEKAGVECQLIVIANGEHGFKGADPAKVLEATIAAATWMKQHLEAPAPANP